MNLKKILFLGIICSLFFNSAIAQVSLGTPKRMNDSWKFILEDPANAQNSDFDDSKWTQLDLPHDWSVKQPLSPNLASCTGYLPGGIGWYRKNVEITESAKGKKIYLYFEGVYNRSEVYINGQLLGKRPNGYVSFMYDLTPYIQYGQKNTVAVRVDHSRYADSRWYTGSGIYRDVWLVEANPIHITLWGVYAYPKSATKKQGVLHVETEVENNTKTASSITINSELLSPAGKVIAKKSQKLSIPAQSSNKASTEITVNNPQLWDLDNPHLYLLKTTIVSNGKIIDQNTTQTGFRTFIFDPNKGFALNGNQMKMKGVCIHHDAGVLGSAVPREVWKKRLLQLKEIGCNAIRTSHNPQATDLYALCDELGLLVLNEAYDEWEFPKRKWIEGWNVGTPGFDGAYDFFAEWGEKDLADMVRRDRNHLSIFAWSIGNEVDYPNDPYSHPVLDGGANTGFTQAMFGGYQKDAPDAMRLGAIAKRLVKAVKQHDTSRPVTAGLAGVAMSNETEYPGALDITGYNYTESMYDSDHKKYPERIIYGSENRHDIDAWKAVRDKEFIFGQFLWTGIDYLGESGKWPSRGFYTGLLNFGGELKPRGHFRQALWADGPVSYIGTYPTPRHERWGLSIDAWPIWNYVDGQSIRVVCYTNAPKARLELNGETIGEVKQYDDNSGVIYWDVPFKKGKLEVVGLNNENQEITRYALQSSGRPYALKVEKIEGETINKDKGLAIVTIQVVDENDVPVMISDDEITCFIKGPGKLLGLEASNNSDMADYTDNVQRAFHGHLLAYIQATGNEGNIDLHFTAPWLKAVNTTIKVK